MKQIFSTLAGCLLMVTTAQAQESDTLRRQEQPSYNSDSSRDRSNDNQDNRRDYDNQRRSDYRDDRELTDKERERLIRRAGLSWFQTGAGFGGASVGFGVGKGQGLYGAFSPRLGFFIQQGLAVGLRGTFESRFSTSYRSNAGGAFVRYYPLRGNFYAFGEAGFNIGKYKSSDVSQDDRRRYSNLNVGLGVGLRALRSLGFELVVENNYYDKTPVLAGSNRGPQIKIGANYHIGSRRRPYYNNY